MVEDQVRYNQVQNIIRRSHALILNIKMLGADTTNAKKLLNTAKTALEKGDYDSAIDYAKKSMVEIMELKKQVKSGAKQKPKPAPEPETKAEDSKDSSTEVNKDKSKSTDKGLSDKFENGFSYIIEENRADICFNIFSNIVSKKHEGLCICRTNPTIIRRKYKYNDEITMLWLTDRESSKESTISPSLESMIYVAEEFIDKNEKAVILLDGLEYLISNNSFNPVLRFIRRLIDKISETESILLIGAGSKAINEQELRLLERELNPIIID